MLSEWEIKIIFALFVICKGSNFDHCSHRFSLYILVFYRLLDLLIIDFIILSLSFIGTSEWKTLTVPISASALARSITALPTLAWYSSYSISANNLSFSSFVLLLLNSITTISVIIFILSPPSFDSYCNSQSVNCLIFIFFPSDSIFTCNISQFF